MVIKVWKIGLFLVTFCQFVISEDVKRIPAEDITIKEAENKIIFENGTGPIYTNVKYGYLKFPFNLQSLYNIVEEFQKGFRKFNLTHPSEMRFYEYTYHAMSEMVDQIKDEEKDIKNSIVKGKQRNNDSIEVKAVFES